MKALNGQNVQKMIIFAIERNGIMQYNKIIKKKRGTFLCLNVMLNLI